MKVEYVEPFVQAACSVFEQVTGGRAKPGPLGLLGATFPAACVNIATRVNGTLRGDVVYSMSSSTAQALAGRLVNAEIHGFGRLAGTGLAQLGNMLAEKSSWLLSEQGLGCLISSPTVFQGLNVEFSAIAPALSVPIDTDAGRIDVNVAVKNDE